MIPHATRTFVCLAFVGAAVGACANEASESPVVSAKSGTVHISSTTPSDVDSLTIGVRCGADTTDRDTLSLAKDAAATSWSGQIGGLPLDATCTFTATGMQGGSALYTGSQAKQIAANTSVSVLLQQIAAPPAFSNEVPRITSLTASLATVTSSDTVTFGVVASDDSASTISYDWSASCDASPATDGPGTFLSTTSPTVRWTAPATGATPSNPANCTITVLVSNSSATTVGSFSIQVVSQ